MRHGKVLPYSIFQMRYFALTVSPSDHQTTSTFHRIACRNSHNLNGFEGKIGSIWNESLGPARHLVKVHFRLMKGAGGEEAVGRGKG